MYPKYADKKANSADPDQTAPSVWSGSTLFAQTCQFKNVSVMLVDNHLKFPNLCKTFNAFAAEHFSSCIPKKKTLNIQTPKKFAVIILKVKQFGFMKK